MEKNSNRGCSMRARNVNNTEKAWGRKEQVRCNVEVRYFISDGSESNNKSLPRWHFETKK